MTPNLNDTSDTHIDLPSEGGVPTDPTLKETAIYTGPHLDRIRELYVSGAPIALPPQITDGERADLDAQRAANLAGTSGATSGTSTGSASVAKLSSTNTAARTTAASGSTAAQSASDASSAGTAGSSSSAK